MKTFAERAWDKGKVKRPTEWAPNGCGPRVTGPVDLVPDKLLGVEFGDDCCDVHDVEYYKGGFLGLFWRKPKADLGLGACLAKRMFESSADQWTRGGVGRKFFAALQAATAIPTAAVYTIAVTALGWTPFTWRWYKRTPPSPKRLREMKAIVNRQAEEKQRATLERTPRRRTKRGWPLARRPSKLGGRLNKS